MAAAGPSVPLHVATLPSTLAGAKGADRPVINGAQSLKGTLGTSRPIATLSRRLRTFGARGSRGAASRTSGSSTGHFSTFSDGEFLGLAFASCAGLFAFCWVARLACSCKRHSGTLGESLCTLYLVCSGLFCGAPWPCDLENLGRCVTLCCPWCRAHPHVRRARVHPHPNHDNLEHSSPHRMSRRSLRATARSFGDSPRDTGPIFSLARSSSSAILADLDYQTVVTSFEDSCAKEDCVICMEPFSLGESIRILPCLHGYHVWCIDQWLVRSRSCPICKASLDTGG